MENQKPKQYHSPKLEIYGNVSKLTQGGSGTQAEPNPGQGNQPGQKIPLVFP